MHVPIANQQLDATCLLVGQSFSLSTAQIAPSCWSLLWSIKREYVGYTLSISFCKFCSLEVMSFTLNSICNKITKIDIHMTNQRKNKTSCDLLCKGLKKNYAGTVLLPPSVNSLQLKIMWTASNSLFLPYRNQNTVSVHDNDHPHEFWDFHSGVVMESILLQCDAVSRLAVPDVSKYHSSFIFRCAEGSNHELQQQWTSYHHHIPQELTLFGEYISYSEKNTQYTIVQCMGKMENSWMWKLLVHTITNIHVT